MALLVDKDALAVLPTGCLISLHAMSHLEFHCSDGR